MPGLADYAGRTVGVLGLARSGLATVRALARVGARPLAYDDRADAVLAAQDLGAAAGDPADVAGLAALVVSPGVPVSRPAPHPLVATARAGGVRITNDIDLFAASHPEATVVGVTGTNGKSTTTALIHHLLREAGRPTLMGGNIGRPVFDLPDPAGQTVVLELSSYQLELAEHLRCQVAVWLNLTPDHLDRHGGLDGYIAAKRRIALNQRPGDAVVVGVDDAPSAALAAELEGLGRRVVKVAMGRSVERGVGVVGATLLDGLDGRARPVAELDGLVSLRGWHNRQNVAAAYAALRCLGLRSTAAALGLQTFRGLPHRMAEVGRHDGVLFVNDSKATNPEAAARSLACFDPIFWIAGGEPKPGGFASLLPHLGPVRGAYLIGRAEAELARALKGVVPVKRCGTLNRALEAALADARTVKGRTPVVLLAPACASFDQFRSYEDRGLAFELLVQALGGQPLPFAPLAEAVH